MPVQGPPCKMKDDGSISSCKFILGVLIVDVVNFSRTRCNWYWFHGSVEYAVRFSWDRKLSCHMLVLGSSP